MKNIIIVVSCLFIIVFNFSSGAAGEHYKGKERPSIDVIHKNLQGFIILGIHKERDGAYLVITERKDYRSGFKLLKLESKKWVIEDPKASLGNEFVFVIK